MNQIYTKTVKEGFELVKSRDIFKQPLTSSSEDEESEYTDAELPETALLDDYVVIKEPSYVLKEEQNTEATETEGWKSLSSSTEDTEESYYDADNESENGESENKDSESEDTAISYFWSSLSSLAEILRAWTFSEPAENDEDD